MFDSATLIAGLPNLPGVYRMLSGQGEVLYVGKARELKRRVASYFQKSNLGPRISMMVSQIGCVEYTVTRSEAEALLLENNLIKSLTPRYNILFRDDKSYPYLVITADEYPRLAFFRGAPDKRSDYFGPFPNSWAVRESIQLLQKVFRLRTCENSVFQNRSRPCLLHQIKRCSAPCVNLIATESYSEDVKNARLFMQGREDDVISSLTAKMQTAAEGLEFERAALYRDQVKSLSRMQQRQYVDVSKALDADAIACVRANGLTCLNLVMVRSGRYLGDKSFFPQHAEEHSLAEVITAFLAQHYSTSPTPPLIVVSDDGELKEITAVLSEQAGRTVSITAHPYAERRQWLEMAQRNAEHALAQRLREQGTQEQRLIAMREALGLVNTVQRIECFDISHTQGEAAVASCVVYDRLSMRNNEYRRYNITGVAPGDDYAAMRQALTRRYGKISLGEGVVPDLILVDGGRGQVNVAREVLGDLGLNEVALVGVAKGPQRKPGQEELIIARDDKIVQLSGDHPGLHLIQQIRDEAHRFAITGHRARRAKARTTSTLESVPGIGSKRRKQLLERFGGLRGVAGASVDDLTKVEGISRKLAEKIYNELH